MAVERFAENPIITPADVTPSRDDFEVVGAFNAGAIKFNGQTLLLMRVAERPIDKSPNEEVAPIYNPQTGKIDFLRVSHGDSDLEIPDPRVFFYKGKTYLTSLSYLRIARSDDGRNFKIDSQPAVFPDSRYETFGLEDPRITAIEDSYYITCKYVSDLGICTGMLETKDFKSFKRSGVSFCPENIDVALFPEKINGLYYALTRPVPANIGSLGIWLTSSPDLMNWGNHRCLMSPRPGCYDSARIGASCVPIKTQKGWLEIYHGADENNRYCLAAALYDLNDPSKVLGYSREPLMQPEADYEMNGFFGNVVFCCGCIVEDDIVTIYYGASDCVMAGAKIELEEILAGLSS